MEPIKTLSEKEISDYSKKLAERITYLRKQKGVSAETYANQIGLARVQYWRYEKQKTDLTFTTLIRVVNGFGITLQEFFSEGFD